MLNKPTQEEKFNKYLQFFKKLLLIKIYIESFKNLFFDYF